MIATPAAFRHELDRTGDRMGAILQSMFRDAASRPGSRIRRGVFYAGGPVCLQVVDAEGRHLASITEIDFESDLPERTAR